jgi:hypothetical protein
MTKQFLLSLCIVAVEGNPFSMPSAGFGDLKLVLHH